MRGKKQELFYSLIDVYVIHSGEFQLFAHVVLIDPYSHLPFGTFESQILNFNIILDFTCF